MAAAVPSHHDLDKALEVSHPLSQERASLKDRPERRRVNGESDPPDLGWHQVR
jgi:hypothetical protein